jgi:rRNA-processing protein FCF1
MGDVLIDACGWVALVDASINIDIALSKVIGPPHFILLDMVLEELEELDAGRPHSRNLILDLLRQRSTLIEHSAMHTDDALLEVAVQRNIPILTVDAEMKRRTLESGLGVLEIVKGKRVRLVDGL